MVSLSFRQRAALGLQSISLLAAVARSAPLAASSNCTASTIAHPDVEGTTILGIQAAPVYNYSYSVAQDGNSQAMNLTNLNFCNVTVTYTHPKTGDNINTQVWLPLSGWNGRFQATGGGGFLATQGPQALAPAVHEGFAAAGTDAGVGGSDFVIGPDAPPPGLTAPWAQISYYNVNQYLLQDFAAQSLHEMTLIGKSVIASVYAQNATYSYFTGCSTGGRQGYMLAQRYGGDYDGILAMAPAINWDTFAVAAYWPQYIMNQLHYYPQACELEAITAAAISACDNLDGVEDGVISNPGECTFDPTSVVGQSHTCADGSKTTITQNGALVANFTWLGPHASNGDFQWYGWNKDAPLASSANGALSEMYLANTNCSSKTVANCTGGLPFMLSPSWIFGFVTKDEIPLNMISHEQWDDLLFFSTDLYGGIIDTADPNLNLFQATGGKLLTWHGMADQLVPTNGTIDYYDRVIAQNSNVTDYYKVFLAPGTQHCMAGNGPFPQNALGSLMDWVEKGEEPVIEAMSTNANGTKVTRNLCEYPSVQTYVGGDPNVASSFQCR